MKKKFEKPSVSISALTCSVFIAASKQMGNGGDGNGAPAGARINSASVGINLAGQLDF